MSDGDYCGGVVISVNNEFNPFYNICKKVPIHYVGVFVFIPLSLEGLGSRRLCPSDVGSDIV